MSWGMNAVIFAWLVVEVLEAPPRWVGIAQSSTMLPALALLLVGGAAADRLDPRRTIVVLHLAAALPILGLATIAGSDTISIPLLLAYGATLGTLQAFVIPARDAVLPRVAGPDLMRAVAALTIFQFGGQAAGSLVAGSADFIGLAAVLGLQALIVSLGALGTRGAPSAPQRSAEQLERSALHDIMEGLGTVARTPNLRVPVSMVAAVGIFFIGPFLVTFPLIVSESYGGGSARFGIVQMMFPLGTIVGSFVLRAIGGIRRKGLALLLSLAGGALTLCVLSQGLPFPLFVFGTLVWGLCGSVFINTSRTMAQEAAPADQRGRVLSAYQLGFAGASPVGAMLAGLVTERIGALDTLLTAGLAMLTLLAITALTTTTARME
jgi:MFS family permease